MIEIGMWIALGVGIFVGISRGVGRHYKIKARPRQPDSALNWGAVAVAAIAAFLFGRSQGG